MTKMNGLRVRFRKWVWATWLGWLLGLPLIIVLALAGETVGLGGAQFLVGAGMGIGTGFMQGRVVRRIHVPMNLWLCITAAGLTAPFLITDLAKVLRWDVPYTLYVCVALGGLLAGLGQAQLLRRRFKKTGWWVFASTLGWILAASTAAIANSLPKWARVRGVLGALAFLGITALGGLVLGFVTGASLVQLPRREKIREPLAGSERH
jgi:hypothetical protein